MIGTIGMIGMIEIAVACEAAVVVVGGGGGVVIFGPRRPPDDRSLYRRVCLPQNRLGSRVGIEGRSPGEGGGSTEGRCRRRRRCWCWGGG